MPYYHLKCTSVLAMNTSFYERCALQLLDPKIKKKKKKKKLR